MTGSNNSISLSNFNDNFYVIINNIKINNISLNIEWLVQQKIDTNNIGNINIFNSYINLGDYLDKTVDELIELSWSNVMTYINVWSANNYDPPDYKSYINEYYTPSNI